MTERRRSPGSGRPARRARRRVPARAMVDRAFPIWPRSSSEPFDSMVTARASLFSRVASIAVEHRGHVGQARLRVDRPAEPGHDPVEEQDERQRLGVGDDDHAVAVRVRVRAPQEPRRPRRAPPPPRGAPSPPDRGIRRPPSSAARPRISTALHQPFALHGSVAVAERLQLAVGGPFRVDGQPATVGKHQAELHDAAVHAEVRHDHGRGKVRQCLAEDVLSDRARCAGSPRAPT